MNIDKKLELAHEYVMKHIQENFDINYPVLVAESWEYADATEVEYNKRKQQQTVEDISQDVGLFEDWQPDWSVAPERATAWKIDDHGVPMWLQSHNNINQPYVWLSDAPNFDYQGDWKDSLRKRP